MRSPTKPKETLSKVLPLRWSFASKDRVRNPAPTRPGELVEYLESGRRPRCTKDPIIALVGPPPQTGAPGRSFEAAHDCSSPSGSSSLSYNDRTGSDTCYSPKIPEGQSRGCVANRDDGSLRYRSSKRARPDHGRNPDLQLQRGALLMGHLSHSAPPSRDSTLRRTKVQTGVTFRTQKDSLQAATEPGDRKGPRAQEGRSHDSLLSFFRPGFMKKDIPRSPVKGHDRRANGQGHLEKLASGHLAKLSLSNGTLTAASGALAGCDGRNCKGQLLNGGGGVYEAADMTRAHSSSDIQARLDLTFRRCASLQRNGDVVAPPARRVLLCDKPSYGTLQRTRYSTASLGRHLSLRPFHALRDTIVRASP